jgi:hypothetical protein
MSVVVDFRRLSSFTVEGANRNGRFLGRGVYWKLYFVENALRVIINTILSIQVDPTPYSSWWEFLYHDTQLMRDVEWRRQRYLADPSHTFPGRHGLYYVFLHDLGTIIHDNAAYFFGILPDDDWIDHWVLKIDRVGLPRNCIGHMNLIIAEDREQISTLYYECKALVRKLQNVKIGPQNLVLQIPEV